MDELREKWRPISEAPKDGSRLLLLNADVRDDPDNAMVGYWYELTGYWCCSAYDMAGIGEPTHFMFLPDPPNAEG